MSENIETFKFKVMNERPVGSIECLEKRREKTCN